jgi:hypothetical protein
MTDSRTPDENNATERRRKLAFGPCRDGANSRARHGEWLACHADRQPASLAVRTYIVVGNRSKPSSTGRADTFPRDRSRFRFAICESAALQSEISCAAVRVPNWARRVQNSNSCAILNLRVKMLTCQWPAVRACVRYEPRIRERPRLKVGGGSYGAVNRSTQYSRG